VAALYRAKMEIIYGRQLLLVGACGNEDWQMLPFAWMRNQELYQIVKMQRSIENL
jgi:hypothetical protein